MKLAEVWRELVVPEDLVYFVHDDDRLVTNPKLAAYCVLNVIEFAVLQALAADTHPAEAISTRVPQADRVTTLERALATLVLNRLAYLPGHEPQVSVPDPTLNMVYYAITDGCNLRCPYCYASSEKCLPDELSTDEACAMIDQAAGLGARTIVFTGGEPLIRRDLFDVAGHAVSLSVRANIITNATLVPDKATAQRIADMFAEVTISVDGGDAEVHDRTRGKGSFARTERALRLLNDCGVVPTLNHVVTNENVGELSRLTDFVQQLEVRQVRLMNHSKLGRGANDSLDFGWTDHLRVQDFVWTSPGGKQLLPDLTAIARSGDIKGNCGMGGNEIYVTSQGNVFPCKLVTGPEHFGGNLREQTLAEIFAAPLFRSLRSATVGKGHLVDCERCYIRGACGGGCRAYHMAESGDIGKNSRHLCRILRHTQVTSYWLSSGVDRMELAKRRDEMTRPLLVRNDEEHPVYQDWRGPERRRRLPVLTEMN